MKLNLIVNSFHIPHFKLPDSDQARERKMESEWEDNYLGRNMSCVFVITISLHIYVEFMYEFGIYIKKYNLLFSEHFTVF